MIHRTRKKEMNLVVRIVTRASTASPLPIGISNMDHGENYRTYRASIPQYSSIHAMTNPEALNLALNGTKKNWLRRVKATVGCIKTKSSGGICGTYERE